MTNVDNLGGGGGGREAAYFMLCAKHGSSPGFLFEQQARDWQCPRCKAEDSEQDLSTCRHGSRLIASGGSGGENGGVTIMLSCTYEDGCALRFISRRDPNEKPRQMGAVTI